MHVGKAQGSERGARRDAPIEQRQARGRGEFVMQQARQGGKGLGARHRAPFGPRQVLRVGRQDDRRQPGRPTAQTRRQPEPRGDRLAMVRGKAVGGVDKAGGVQPMVGQGGMDGFVPLQRTREGMDAPARVHRGELVGKVGKAVQQGAGAQAGLARAGGAGEQYGAAGGRDGGGVHGEQARRQGGDYPTIEMQLEGGGEFVGPPAVPEQAVVAAQLVTVGGGADGKAKSRRQVRPRVEARQVGDGGAAWAAC